MAGRPGLPTASYLRYPFKLIDGFAEHFFQALPKTVVC
jgi:hypothetical protein